MNAARLSLLVALFLALLPPASAAGATATNPTPLPPGHVPVSATSSKPARDRSRVTDDDRQWWAFQPLRRVEPPTVRAAKAVQTPIDRFIVAKLEERRIKPSPKADRRTLIRRASFDLLGLPPTPDEVDGFTRDQAPDAWSRLVARLLDSPRYGERWARHWLDVARFAESSGFEHDYDRPHAYHYRDFVIRALNSDLPYDDFVRWQIAGDEFEPDNPLALMATGFLGAGVFPTQITANEVERTRYDAMDDMLATTGTAMLGFTIGCARCHDHKFDPIPNQDYYRMLATFTSTVRSEIELDLNPDDNRRTREAFDREHGPLVAAREKYEATELPIQFEAWLSGGATLPAQPQWEMLQPSTLKSRAGSTFRALDDGSYLVEGANGDTDVYTFTAEVRTSGLRALRLEAMAHPSMTRSGPGRADNGNIGLSRVRVLASPLSGGPTNEVPLAKARATFQQNAEDLSVSAALDRNPRSGWAVDPKFGTNHAAIFEFAQPIGFPEGARLEVRLEFEVNTRHNIGRPRLAVTTAASPGFDGPVVPMEVASILEQHRRSPAELLSGTDRRTLMAWWKALDPGWQILHSKVEAHARQSPKPKLTKVMVCAEGYPAIRMHTQGADFFPETYFLSRGSTDQKKGVATPGFPEVLLRNPAAEKRWRSEAPTGAKFSGRRRALAQWLTDAEQGAGPLLARVIVNRLWQHHFGQGLVATPNDFGVQGTKPSHPELLEWLAAELIRNGWRLKPIHQLIMTSAVYQQRAATDAEQLKADPDNTLWSRSSSRRLEAEAIRDSLLFVCGVLDTNMYGPGTLDEASRRRSVYFTVKRSRLVPVMQAFDAPEPLVSQGARPSTTVAPQALILMNNPQVRTWAAAFASRCVAPGGDSRSRRREEAEAAANGGRPPRYLGGYESIVDRAYALALNRPPSKGERAEAVRFIEAQQERHATSDDSSSATSNAVANASGGAGVTSTNGVSTVSTARMRALTDFAQVVLSLNEFVYVE